MSSNFVDAPMHDRFVEFTRNRMSSPIVAERFRELKRKVEAIRSSDGGQESVDVLDVGCGMGVQAAVWAEDGYRVTAVDLDPDLIRLGSENAASARLPIDFRVGSAEKLPFDDDSFDVCMTIELIEHVEDWTKCLDEACRVLRPGGVLALTTSNVLCPVQHEYRLPLFSWWPARFKRLAHHLASTRYPALANYSPCPARHWFTVFQLQRELEQRGMRTLDRIDAMNVDGYPFALASLVRLARTHASIKWLAYLVLTGTIVFGIKQPATVPPASS